MLGCGDAAPSAVAVDAPSPAKHDAPRVDASPPVAVEATKPVVAPPEGWSDLEAVVPGIRLDIRYATANNFTGAPLPGYAGPRAWMRDFAAAALARVQADLAADGLGLLVFDAYRPVRATTAMVRWARATRREDLLRDGYIAGKSKHNQGVAIDLTLVDLATGEPLAMGTEFDTFDESAAYKRGSPDVMRNRTRLRRAMQAHGFAPYDKEWWHFTFITAEPTPPLDRAYE